MTNIEKFRELLEEYQNAMNEDGSGDGLSSACSCCIDKLVDALWTFPYQIGFDAGEQNGWEDGYGVGVGEGYEAAEAEERQESLHGMRLG